MNFILMKNKRWNIKLNNEIIIFCYFINIYIDKYFYVIKYKQISMFILN